MPSFQHIVYVIEIFGGQTPIYYSALAAKQFDCLFGGTFAGVVVIEEDNKVFSFVLRELIGPAGRHYAEHGTLYAVHCA
jgi:hypothetical protein